MPGVVAPAAAGDNGDRDNLALLFGGLDPNSPLVAGMMPGAIPGAATATPSAMTGPAAALADSGPGPSAVPPNGVMPMPQNPPQPPTLTPIPQVPQALRDQLVKARTPTDRSQYRPHWYERLEGALVGAGAGFGNANAGAESGGAVTNRRYNAAETDRTRSLAPLLEQERQYEQSQGPIEKGNEEQSQNYRGQASNYDQLMRQYELQLSRQDQQAGAAPRIDNTDPDNPRFFYMRRGGQEFEGPAPSGWESNQRRSEEDKNTPAPGATPEKRLGPDKKIIEMIRTKAGGYIPYSPKTIDQGALEGDATATRLFNQQHPGKDADKRGTRNQFVNAQSKRDSAWTKAKSEYDRQSAQLSPKDTEGLNRARADYYDARQQAQNSFEDNVDTLGGESSHVELPRNHFGEQPAAPAGGGGGQTAAAAPSRKAGDVVKLKGVGSVRITKMHSDGKTFDYVKAGAQGQ